MQCSVLWECAEVLFNEVTYIHSQGFSPRLALLDVNSAESETARRKARRLPPPFPVTVEHGHDGGMISREDGGQCMHAGF